MKILVTGAAGFVGSHVVDRLLAQGHEVVGVDNFSTGRREFLEDAGKNKRFRLVERDLLDPTALNTVLTKDIEWVFHLSANADVRDGLKHPRKDLEQNTLVTSHVLEAMRLAGVHKIIFISTGSVYGEPTIFPTPENCPFPIQTSLYAASKVSAEALVSAYAEGYAFRGLIFRFVSILGERYTHGHVLDFVRQLEKNPKALSVLGNGKQKKSYLYIGDCIDAILTAMRHDAGHALEIYNLGTDEYVEVNDSIREICDEMQVSPALSYSGGERGWIGDSPFIFLDCAKIRKLGWKPQKTIRDSVRLTVRYIRANHALFDIKKGSS